MKSRRLIICQLIVALFPGLVAASDVSPGTYYYEMRTNDDKSLCIDIKGGKAKPGSTLQLYRCHGANNSKLNQRWEYNRLNELIGDGGICLDSYDKGGGEGSQLKMQPCNASEFQKWTFDISGPQRDPSEPRLTIRSSKGLCIGIQGGKLKEGTPLVLTNCQRKTWVTWRQVRIQSISSLDCAKQVRKLNDKYLKDIGVSNTDMESACEQNGNNVYQTFTGVMDRAMHDKRNRVLQGVKRELNIP